MTDADIIARVADMFGKKMHQFGNGKRKDGTPGFPIYVTCISGSRAMAFMQAILPIMGKRRAAKIKEVISAYAARPFNPESRKEACRNSVAAKAYHEARRARFPPNWPTNEELAVLLRTKTHREIAATIGITRKHFYWYVEKAERNAGVRLRPPHGNCKLKHHRP